MGIRGSTQAFISESEFAQQLGSPILLHSIVDLQPCWSEALTVKSVADLDDRQGSPNAARYRISAAAGRARHAAVRLRCAAAANRCVCA